MYWQSATLPKAIIPPDNLYPRALFDKFAEAYTRLQKAALIVNGFHLGDQEIAYFSDHRSDFDGFDLNALPLKRDAGSEGTLDANAPVLFKAWRRVNDYATLRGSLPHGEVSLVDVFSTAAAGDTQTPPALSTPGLTASYSASKDLSGPPTLRADLSVAFDGTGTTPASSIPPGTGSARWSGLLLAPNDGAFTFAVSTDGASVQLWIGDGTALALTRNAGTNEWVSAPATLKGRQFYDLRLEVTQIAVPTPPHTSTVVELSWQSPTIPKAIIPSDYLFTGVLATIAETTGWDPQIVAALVGARGFNLAAANFRNEIRLIGLQECVRLIKRLGVSADQLFHWASQNTDFAENGYPLDPRKKR